MNQSTSKTPSSGKNYLFAIAIDEYYHLTTSDHRKSGLENIIQILTTQFHFSPDHTFTLYNDEATTQSIYKKFEELVGLLNADDNLIIYFSGQGEYKEVFNQGYWVPVDAEISTQYISNSEIFSILNSLSARHILLLTDSCFSSSFFDEDEIPSGNVSSDLGSRWIISAQRVNLVSESYPDQDIFNKTILSYLSTLDGSLNVLDLQKNILENIPTSENMDPMGGALTIAGHQGGVWKMEQKPNEEKEWKTTLQNNTLTSYKSFLVNFPDGKYKAEATKKIEEIEVAQAKQRAIDAELKVEDDAWNEAVATNSIAAFMEYKMKFPDGKYSAQADQKIAMISISGTPAQKENQPADILPVANTEYEKPSEKPSEKPAPRNLGTRKIGRTNKEILPPADLKKYGKWAAMILLPLLLLLGGYQMFKSMSKKDEPSIHRPKETNLTEVKDPVSSEPDQTDQTVTEEPVVTDEGDSNETPMEEPDPIDPNELVETPMEDPVPRNIDEPTQDPNEREANRLSTRGDQHFRNGRWSQAKSDYTRANNLVPSDYLAQRIKICEDNLSKPAPPTVNNNSSPRLPTAVKNLIKTGLQGIRGGSFEMGSTDAVANEDEKYVRTITVSGFMIGKYEVTQKLYKAVMGSNPSSNRGCDDCPVDNVSWNDAQNFIKRLNNMTSGSSELKGKKFRLPTEAEWEYAAKAGGNLTYSGSNNINAKAWYRGNSNGKTQTPSKKNTRNDFGLYNMSGNVAEWCSDWYEETYYSSGNDNNPRNTTPGIAGTRVVRGGSFKDEPKDCRVSNRYSMHPRAVKNFIGFRLVLD